MGDPICLQVEWKFQLSRTIRSIVAISSVQFVFDTTREMRHLPHQRVLYDYSGIQVGIMMDSSNARRRSPLR